MSSAVDERGRKKIIGSHTCTHTHNQRNHFKAPDPRMRFDRKRLFFLGKPGKKCSCFALARLIISRAEPLCDATIWYLPPGCPSVPPGDFLLHVPSQKELQLSEIRCLAEKGRLHVDDDGVLRHVRKKKRPPAPGLFRQARRAWNVRRRPHANIRLAAHTAVDYACTCHF